MVCLDHFARRTIEQLAHIIRPVGIIFLETEIRAPIERVFDLSRDLDLHVRSMSSSGERIIAGRKTGLLGLGESVTWETRHMGRRWTMRSSIVEYERPWRFVDIGEGGPFTRFEHEHVFKELESTSLMTDLLSFNLKASYLGFVSDPLIARPYLRRLLRMRNRYLKMVAEGGS